MPLVSNIYSFVTSFISSMILPTKEKGIGSFIFGHIFKNLWDWIMTGFYQICKWFLAFMDFLQYFIQKLIGLDYWLDSAIDGRRSLSEAATEDTIFKFLYADSVQKVFRALCALFVVLLIIFTIFQIIKSEWDFMTGDGKGGNSKAAIFRSSIKAIVLVIAFPILLVMGIISSNAILASIIKAVGVDMSETFGGKIFSISAQPANKYRHYADADAYRPTTDQITFYLNDNEQLIAFGDDPDDQYHDYYSIYTEYLEAMQTGRKITLNSIFDPLVPKHEENFSGFCFRVDDDNGDFEYYFIKANSSNKDDVYNYLTRCMGAKVLNKNSSWASDETGLDLIDGIGSNFNSLKNDGCYITGLNIQKGSDTVRNVCRNSWNYSLVYITPNKKLSQVLSSVGNQPLTSYDLGSTGEVGSILYNSEHISAYFDGGQFGVVQSRSEYLVMADVIDFMCDNNLTFYIMNATSPLIDWNYHYDKDEDGTVEADETYMVENQWISNKVSGAGGRNPSNVGEFFLNESQHSTILYDDASDDSKDIKALTFLTKYSNNYALPAESEQDVIYNASFTGESELEGARYIVCMKGDQSYFPLVNGVEISIGGKEYKFSSSQYASEYHGVVWAKGTFDMKTVDAVYGNPTYLKNTSTFENGKLKTKADADGAYYYNMTYDDATGTAYVNLYTYFTQKIGNTLYAYNGGNIYVQGETSFSGVSYDTDEDVVNLTKGAGQGFSCTYTLKPTGRSIEHNGNEYLEYASAESGICYILYRWESSFARLKNDGTLESGFTNGSSLYPYIMSKTGAKETRYLAIRSQEIPNFNMNESDAQSTLKNSFSIFSDDEYVGTFSKRGLIEIPDFDGILTSTKEFKANWGGTYYNMNVQGTVTKATTGSAITGKYNETLNVTDDKLKTMLVNFETTQASDSVTCYRNHIENFSGNSFGAVLIEINIALFKAIVDIKTGMVKQVGDTPLASTTFSYAGANSGITFDYFFDQGLSVKTFYAPSKINYFVLLVSSVLIIKVLFSALWGVIKRFYMITLYYLAMPVAASTMPIDGGSRFTNIRNEITGEVLSTYGVLIGLNVFFVLLAPIKEISQTIFTEEMIANSGSYFLQKLPISAKMLNEFIYILFLLVAFTLIGELPTVIQTMVGKGKSVDVTGANVQKNVKTTMGEAREMISGKALMGSVKGAVTSIPGFIPGSALIGSAVKGTNSMVRSFTQNFRQGYSQTFGANSQAGNTTTTTGSSSQTNNRQMQFGANDDEQNGMSTNGAVSGGFANARENGLGAVDEYGNPIGGTTENSAVGMSGNPLDGPPMGDMSTSEEITQTTDMLIGKGSERALDAMNVLSGEDAEDGGNGPFGKDEIDPQKEAAKKEKNAAYSDYWKKFGRRSSAESHYNTQQKKLETLKGLFIKEKDGETPEEKEKREKHNAEVQNKINDQEGVVDRAKKNLNERMTEEDEAKKKMIHLDSEYKKKYGDEPIVVNAAHMNARGGSGVGPNGNQTGAGGVATDEERIRQIVREELGRGSGQGRGLGTGKGQGLGLAEDALENGKPGGINATKEELEARKSLRGHRASLLETNLDIMSARATLLNPRASEQDKVAARLNLNEANAKRDKIKKDIANDKKTIESSMTPERKAARKQQITNTVMNSVGAVATVAATVAGGPLAGILVHKTAKNLKKAAPAVIDKITNKYGELKGQVKQFKAADGWGKAEMLSSMAMKSSGVAAGGYLAAKVALPIIGLAAPIVGPVAGKIGAFAKDYNIPLWAIGATALSGALSKKIAGSAESGRSAINGNNVSRGRVVQPGAGADIPAQAVGQGVSAQNARTANVGPTAEEKQARSNYKKHKRELSEAKSKRKELQSEANAAQDGVDEAQAELNKLREKDKVHKVSNREMGAAIERLNKAKKYKAEKDQEAQDAKDHEKSIKKAITDDKVAIDKSMSPERKAARRQQITNAVLNSVGTAATVAATVAGGPLAGILIHKTAKNIKKAAPAVMNKAGSKFAEFRKADGWKKAEIISNMVMKGAAIGAVGALVAPHVAPAVKFAEPAISAVGKFVKENNIPLWAIGAAGLTGVVSKKLSTRMASSASFVNPSQGRVVQTGTGANIPEQTSFVTNARRGGVVKMPAMTQAEADARKAFSAKKEEYSSADDAAKKAQGIVKTKEKAQKDIDKKIKKNERELDNINKKLLDDSYLDLPEGEERAKKESEQKKIRARQKELLAENKDLESKKKDAGPTDEEKANAKKAKAEADKIKNEKTIAKKEIEKNMSPERKAARRERIANVVMNSVGTAGTIAATAMGGPLMGILVHKTAKNLKKAAPAVVHKVANTVGELKGQVGQFKAADGWGKAEMLSSMAMKGAGLAAGGYLAAKAAIPIASFISPAIQFAAPALKTIKDITADYKAPLWALGAVGLSGALSRKLTGGRGYINSRRRFVSPGTGAEFINDSFDGDFSQDTGFAATPSRSVTRPQTVQETQNAFVYDESRIAEIVRRVLKGEDLLRNQSDKMEAAAHYVNYGAMYDTAFVSNRNDAYRNAVVNSMGTRGSRVVIGDTISNFAANAAVGVDSVLLHGYKNSDGSDHAALLSADSKVAIYKSMMSDEQKDTFKQMSAQNQNFDALNFIEDKMRMKLGATYSQDKGIVFNVNGATVSGKGERNDAVNSALKEVMNSGEISSKAVVDSLNRTGYMENTSRAISENYALTIDYDKEKSGNITGSDYHQVVFDRARANEDLNAEALYEYIKKDKTPDGRLETFNSEYHINENTPMTDILDSVKSGVRNNNELFAKIKPEDYSTELSAVVSRHVADGSFKVDAFDMLSRKDQLGVAENISANINAASSGATYAYTEEEKAVKLSVSNRKISDEEFVNATLNTNPDGLDQVVDTFVGQQAQILDANNNYDPEAAGSKRILKTINADEALKAKKESLSGLHSEGDIVLGYAKAEVAGTPSSYDTFVGDNSQNRRVVEHILKNDENAKQSGSSGTAKTSEESSKAEQITKADNASLDLYRQTARKEYTAKVATQLDDKILSEENKAKVFESAELTNKYSKELSDLLKNKADDAQIKAAQEKLAAQEKIANEQKDEYNNAVMRRADYTTQKGRTDNAFDKLDMMSNQAFLDSELATAEQFKNALDDDSHKYLQRIGHFSDAKTKEENLDHNIFRDKILAKAGLDFVGLAASKEISEEDFGKIRGALDGYMSELQTAKDTKKKAEVEAAPGFSSEEFVKAAMGDTSQKPGAVANKLIMGSVGLKHSNGNIDVTSESYAQFLDEMTSDESNKHWGESLVGLDSLDGDSAKGLVLGYAKAKILGEQGDSKKMSSFIGENANSRNQEVVSKIVAASQVDPSQDIEAAFKDIELYGNLSDKDVRNYATAPAKQKKMHEEIKAAFGFVKGGDAETNVAAERAAAKYISSNGQNQDLLNAQGINVNQALLRGVNDKYFTARGLNGATLAQDITTSAELMKSDEQERSRIEKLFELQNNGRTKASLLRMTGDKENLTPGQFTNLNARNAVNSLRAEYLVGNGDISELKTNASGKYKPATLGTFANFARQMLPSDQVEAINRTAAENGFSTLSIAQQNGYTARAAQNDEGAKAILAEHNIDITSLMDVSQFLNSPFGAALKERLIAKISQEITALDIFAHRLGVNDAGVYSLVKKITSESQDAAHYEKAQGNLISMERVKERAEKESSDGADSIAKNAAARIQVLSKEEKEKAEIEGIYNHILASDNIEKKTAILASSNVIKAEQESGKLAGMKEVIKLVSEQSEENKREVEIGSISSKLSATQEANERAMVGGGLERQRKVADSIWSDDDSRSLARARYRKDNRGAELENLNDIDRNNYLFSNYDRFLSSESDARKKVDNIMKKSDVNFENAATSNGIIKNLTQTEFDTVTKGMKQDGDAAVSQIKQSIIKDMISSNSLTEIPNENKMSKEEIKEFNSAKSQLEQDYRKNNFDERFAELFRNANLATDMIRDMLLSGNPNLSDIDIAKFRDEALRNNMSFMGGAIESVLASKGYEEILDKVKAYLKANGNIDYDQLSSADKGRAVNELLANNEFMKASGINENQLKKDIESEFAKRAATATNYDVKLGIPSEQILSFLRMAQGEAIRDQLMRIGAYRPSNMYRRERYQDARIHYGLNHYLMRRMVVRTVMSTLYRSPVIRKMIEEDKSLYAPEIKRMSQAEARKYINEHLDELTQRLGEKMLLDKDKRGNYTLKQTVNKTVVNNVFNNLERNDATFASKIREMFNSISNRSKVGVGSDGSVDLEDIYRRLVGRFENSSQFKGIVERITKPTIQEQIESFFSKGETENRIHEIARYRLRYDRVFARIIYENANTETANKIRDLENDLAALTKKLNGLKK